MNELIIVCPNCGCEMHIGRTCDECGTKDYTEITNNYKQKLQITQALNV